MTPEDNAAANFLQRYGWGIPWEDTESAARMVAHMAVDAISEARRQGAVEMRQKMLDMVDAALGGKATITREELDDVRINIAALPLPGDDDT